MHFIFETPQSTIQTANRRHQNKTKKYVNKNKNQASAMIIVTTPITFIARKQCWSSTISASTFIVARSVAECRKNASLLRGRFWRFSPGRGGATRCTDGGEIWHGGVDLWWSTPPCQISPPSVLNGCGAAAPPADKSNTWLINHCTKFVQPLDLKTASPWRSPSHVVFFSVDSTWNHWLSEH